MEYLPLPKYDMIDIKNIPKASSLIFYNGNRLTEWAGNKIYKFPYKPCPFHAAFFIEPGWEDGLYLNVGKFRCIQSLKAEFKSNRRIDVIIYNSLSDQLREMLDYDSTLNSTRPRFGFQLPDYGFTDFLRFGLRFIPPSKKDFCSENVVKLFEYRGVKVSEHKAVDTAPWDLLEFAYLNQFEIRTVWAGEGFIKKYG